MIWGWRKKAKAARRLPLGSQAVSPGELLRSVPRRNEQVQLVRKRGGGATAEIPVPPRCGKVRRMVSPQRTHHRVELDPIGTRILDLIDGRRNVEALVEDFAIENKLSFREAQLPVMQFLYGLIQRTIVSISRPAENAP